MGYFGTVLKFKPSGLGRQSVKYSWPCLDRDFNFAEIARRAEMWIAYPPELQALPAWVSKGPPTMDFVRGYRCSSPPG